MVRLGDANVIIEKKKKKGVSNLSMVEHGARDSYVESVALSVCVTSRTRRIVLYSCVYVRSFGVGN